MENQTTSTSDNGKTVAIVSYITLIGWIVALIVHGNNKTRLGAYHLRQSLGLMILAVAIRILDVIIYRLPLGGGAGMALGIGLLIFWIMGLVAAAKGEEKPLPLVGDLFQKWFAGLGV